MPAGSESITWAQELKTSWTRLYFISSKKYCFYCN